MPADVLTGSTGKQTTLTWGSVVVWVLATVIGGPIAYLLPQQVLAIVDAGGWLLLAVWSLAGALFGAAAGIIAGFGQRLAMRRSVQWTSEWVVGTVVGWSFAGALLMLMIRAAYSEMIDNEYASSSILALTWFIYGSVIGLIQWFVLRRKVPGAAWWIVSSSLGWGLGGFMSTFMLSNGTELMERGGIVGILAVLLTLGAGTSVIPGVITAMTFRALIARQ